METFASLSANLKLNISQFAEGMRSASDIAHKFAANLNSQINEGMYLPAKKAKMEFKDVARIVQGILISKAFYGGLNAIRNATRAVWEFSQELEYAQIAFSNLFGSTDLAVEFINVLKDFAATTQFSFTESEQAAKRLLAYGIQYKNVMFMMQGIMSASSMSGDPQTIQSVSRAMGQIYTKGRLMNEEMRQLAEAGIPAYEILRKKLGLTQKQLQNLGDMNVPASTAINALIDGMNERFGGVVAASSKTIKGIISNIKDNASMIASSMVQPIVDKFKVALDKLGTGLFNAREIVETSGVGGLLESMFPPELQGLIRTFVANMKALGNVLKVVASSNAAALNQALTALLHILNALLPIIIAAVDVQARVVQAILQNETAARLLTGVLTACASAWVLFKIKALGALALKGLIGVIHGVATAVAFLSKALAANPILTLFTLIAAGAIGLAVASKTASGSLSELYKKMTSFNGVDPDKVLLPSQEERANDLGKFNERLDDTSNSMDELASSTGKATKAAKGLLAFDEVFKLKDPDEGAGSGSINPDFNLGDFATDFGNALIPDMPDVSGVAQDFVDKLVGAFGDRLLDSGIGATIGALLGFAIGGPVGAKLGALAGTLAGFFWEDFKKEFGVVDTQGLSALIGSTLVGVLAGAGKYLLGSIIVTNAETGMFAGLAHTMGNSLAQCVKFGVVGMIVNLGAGLLSNALTGWLAKEFELTEQDLNNSAVGQSVGSLFLSVAGLILGGPMGAIAGGALGQLAGSIVGEFWDYLSTTLQGSIIGGVAGLPIGALVGTLVGSIGGPLGAALGAAIGAGIGAIGGFIADNWTKITTFLSETKTAFTTNCDEFKKAVSTSWAEVKNNFTTNMEGIKTSVTTKWSEIKTGTSEFLSEFGTTMSNKWTEFKDTVKTSASDMGLSISTKWTEIRENTRLSFEDMQTTISTKVTEAKNAAATGFENMRSTISTKLSEAQSKVQIAWSDIKTNISTKASESWLNVQEKFSRMKSHLEETLPVMADNVRLKFTDIKESISTKAGEAFTSVRDYFSNIARTVAENMGLSKESVKESIEKILTDMKEWCTNIWDNVFGKLFGWIDDGINKLKEFLGLNEQASKAPPPPQPTSPTKGNTKSSNLRGHAYGGVFNREHVARFAEGNKAEAIIPLENAEAMRPFVTAVADGIISGLAPILVARPSENAGSQLRPLYVGTLVADERGLRELNKKMRIISAEEDDRRFLQ